MDIFIFFAIFCMLVVALLFFVFVYYDRIKHMDGSNVTKKMLFILRNEDGWIKIIPVLFFILIFYGISFIYFYGRGV